MNMTRFSASSMLFPEVVASSSSEMIFMKLLILITRALGTSTSNEFMFQTHRKWRKNKKNSKHEKNVRKIEKKSITIKWLTMI